MSKIDIRSAIKEKLKTLPPTRLRRMSSALAARLFAMKQWREADSILAYMGMENEVDTRPMIARALAAGKRVYLPRVDGEALVFHAVRDLAEASVRHPYGMLEPGPGLPRLPLPLPARSRVLALVPGLAFDRARNRLGRGKGFYDRFLRDFAARAGCESVFFLGVGYHQQLLDALPSTAADVRLDAVLTDEEIVC